MPNEIDLLFDEISVYKGKCKYPNCLHISENGCKVKENIEKIPKSRYQSYIAFVEEAKSFKEKVKTQGNKSESAHKTNNNKTVVKISNRKRESARNTLKQNIYKDLKDERIN